ncbi:MAG: histidine kinase [Bacteroidetes bacterium]|nr:histidine kinase [Bacteroidota bacterium]
MDHNIQKLGKNPEDIQFFDLFDQDDIQKLQDLFSAANKVSSVIMDLDGNMLTKPSNFTPLCKMIMEKSTNGSPACFAYDQWNKDHKDLNNTTVSPCTLSGYWFETAFISVGENPIAIWQMGQVRSMSYDINQIEEYANKSGIEKTTFLQAFLKAPVVTIYEFENVAKLFFTIANELSEKAFRNLQLSRQIDEIEKINSELTESEQRFKALHDASFGGIAIHKNGIIIECNYGLSDISGYTREELLGLDILTLIDPDYLDYVTDQMKNKSEKSYEVMGLRKNGDSYPVRVQGKNVFYKGEPVRTVEFRDITEQKLAEAELIRKKELAEESNRAKSAFIANMSHDIRTPMNGILGFADLLKDAHITPKEQLEYIQIIENSGALMLEIINEIIHISKIEAGLIKTNISSFNIKELLQNNFNKFEQTINQKGIILKYYGINALKNFIVKSDQDKVDAILYYVLKFGIQNTIQGGVELQVVEKDQKFEFTIKDTGLGISPERVSTIFDRFSADQYLEKSHESRGLDLIIAKSYIEMLGGTIHVSSQLGFGTTIAFSLPLDFEKYKDSPETNAGGRTLNIANLQDLKVLIAEDDETSALLLSTYLKPYTKAILHSPNGEKAVEMARMNPDLDLIMMDIQMPLLNGFNATKQIREFNTSVIVIAQTAFGLSGDRDKALEAGCSDYISKPIKKEELNGMLIKFFPEKL